MRSSARLRGTRDRVLAGTSAVTKTPVVAEALAADQADDTATRGTDHRPGQQVRRRRLHPAALIARKTRASRSRVVAANLLAPTLDGIPQLRLDDPKGLVVEDGPLAGGFGNAVTRPVCRSVIVRVLFQTQRPMYFSLRSMRLMVPGDQQPGRPERPRTPSSFSVRTIRDRGQASAKSVKTRRTTAA